MVGHLEIIRILLPKIPSLKNLLIQLGRKFTPLSSQSYFVEVDHTSRDSDGKRAPIFLGVPGISVNN